MNGDDPRRVVTITCTGILLSRFCREQFQNRSVNSRSNLTMISYTQFVRRDSNRALGALDQMQAVVLRLGGKRLR